MAKKTSTRKSSAPSKNTERTSRPRVVVRTDAAPADITPERLRQTRARLVHLSDHSIAALDARHTDAQRNLEGNKTRGRDTLADACVMLVIAEEQLRAHGDKIGCEPEYLSYVNVTIERLQTAIDHEEVPDGETIRTRGQAEKAARAERNALLAQLSRIAGKATAERADLTRATGGADSRDDVARSLGGLVALGRAWIASSDPSLRARCAVFQLSASRLDHAARVQRTIIDASGEAIGGRAITSDTPEVNRAEGGVLLELKTLIEIFDEAHANDPTVRSLPIQHVRTRDYLRNSHHALAGDSPAAPSAPATATIATA